LKACCQTTFQGPVFSYSYIRSLYSHCLWIKSWWYRSPDAFACIQTLEQKTNFSAKKGTETDANIVICHIVFIQCTHSCTGKIYANEKVT